ncbi:signal peptidase II [Dethiosulfatarculus sandiegensis]|uniref:Lipoprotein signal peptidase n=1 Tax=Dethiosulfatarculus sandiegensis TaxID=1429043 RepID=A0A0D2J3C0_9BACT|nr:signal peptidase II [Dethiosulfatarculus sandiegensis]KIX12699.1 peptidase A8 [Dethiosulfatarculus sandiegensis]
MKRLQKMAVIAFMVVGLDQLTKALAVHYLGGQGGVPIIPGFAELVLVYNRGAAFGIFSDFVHAKWLLAVLTLVALFVAGWVALGKSGNHPQVQLSLGLIAGGALGNLVDRLRLGQVIDFIHLYAGNWHFPAFNLADVAINAGGFLIAWLLLRGKI